MFEILHNADCNDLPVTYVSRVLFLMTFVNFMATCGPRDANLLIRCLPGCRHLLAKVGDFARFSATAGMADVRNLRDQSYPKMRLGKLDRKFSHITMTPGEMEDRQARIGFNSMGFWGTSFQMPELNGGL